MGRVAKAIKLEVIELLPVVAFFFMAFNLVVLTDMLTTERYGIHVFSFIGATIGALIVGKVALIVNLLPFKNKFRGKPLIYSTLWVAFLYVILSFVVRYLDYLIHFIGRTGSLSTASSLAIAQFATPKFWAIQIWLVVLFFIFAALQELAEALGRGELRRMFFGQRLR